MPIVKGSTREYFPKVREAREALRERAIEILESYIAVCAEARAAGNFDVAAKSLQWLIEHMPKEEGQSVIDSSASKPKEIDSGPKRPSIQIGIALGGITGNKELPQASVIDITPDDK